MSNLDLKKDLFLDLIKKDSNLLCYQEGTQRRFNFSADLAERICECVAQGEFIKDLSSRGGPSYNQILIWRRKYKIFDTALESAEQSRRDYLYEKTLTLHEKMPLNDKTEISRYKAVVSTLKWGVQAGSKKYKTTNPTIINDKSQHLTIKSPIDNNIAYKKGESPEEQYEKILDARQVD